jgi:hypothetical protein
MKFQRQPRALGTICFYAPSNKLLIPDGINRGDQVFVIDYPQSRDDMYVTVANIKWWSHKVFRCPAGKPLLGALKDYISRRIPPGDRIMVIWKDLAQ